MKMVAEPKIELFNADWRDILPRYESNWFDLAIVDPPYGKNVDNGKEGNFVMTKHKSKNWDLEPPGIMYFEELRRVSKNQIIWGGNYFPLPETECMVVWDKVNPLSGKFSDAELAWTSFSGPTRIYKQPWIGYGRHFKEKQPSIHPAQKPVALYRWLLQNYAKEGDKILDTHLGSGSIAIACFEEKFELVACEIDEDYFAAMKKRYDEYRKQLQLFS